MITRAARTKLGRRCQGLLGVVALRAGTKIHYAADNMRVTNLAANDYLTRTGSRMLIKGPRRKGSVSSFPLIGT